MDKDLKLVAESSAAYLFGMCLEDFERVGVGRDLLEP